MKILNQESDNLLHFNRILSQSELNRVVEWAKGVYGDDLRVNDVMILLPGKFIIVADYQEKDDWSPFPNSSSIDVSFTFKDEDEMLLMKLGMNWQ